MGTQWGPNGGPNGRPSGGPNGDPMGDPMEDPMEDPTAGPMGTQWEPNGGPNGDPMGTWGGGPPEDGAVAVVAHAVVIAAVGQSFGQAEVADLHAAVALQQHIASRQVPVDVVQGVQVGHALHGGGGRLEGGGGKAANLPHACNQSNQPQLPAGRRTGLHSPLWERGDGRRMHKHPPTQNTPGCPPG